MNNGFYAGSLRRIRIETPNNKIHEISILDQTRERVNHGITLVEIDVLWMDMGEHIKHQCAHRKHIVLFAWLFISHLLWR